MRRAWLAGLLVASGASCGAATEPGDTIGPPACSHGPSLVQTGSGVIVTAADLPLGPDPSGTGFAELSSMAATHDGKSLLVTWTTFGGASVGVAQGHIVVVHPGVGGNTASAPTDGPAGGQAVFDGTDFLVVGRTSGPILPGEPGSFSLQRFGVEGLAAGGPATIGSTPDNGEVSSAAWTAGGLAVAWSSAGAAGFVAHVQLVGADGTLRHALDMDPHTVDPATGLVGLAAPAVAAFDGQLVAAGGQTVSTLDWLGGSAQTSRTTFTVDVPIKRLPPAAFETGGNLMLWGLLDNSVGLYAGTPGGSFTLVRPVSPSAITQQSDGCGGVVTLSNSGQTIEIAADASPGGVVRLGTTILQSDNLAVMTRLPSGFAVAWAAADGLHLTTLAWQ